MEPRVLVGVQSFCPRLQSRSGIASSEGARKISRACLARGVKAKEGLPDIGGPVLAQGHTRMKSEASKPLAKGKPSEQPAPPGSRGGDVLRKMLADRVQHRLFLYPRLRAIGNMGLKVIRSRNRLAAAMLSVRCLGIGGDLS